MTYIFIIFTFLCSYMAALDVPIDTYTVNIVDGYGWKTTELPDSVKKAGPIVLIQKDGGMKTIMINVTVDEKKVTTHRSRSRL